MGVNDYSDASDPTAMTLFHQTRAKNSTCIMINCKEKENKIISQHSTVQQFLSNCAVCSRAVCNWFRISQVVGSGFCANKQSHQPSEISNDCIHNYPFPKSIGQ